MGIGDFYGDYFKPSKSKGSQKTLSGGWGVRTRAKHHLDDDYQEHPEYKAAVKAKAEKKATKEYRRSFIHDVMSWKPSSPERMPVGSPSYNWTHAGEPNPEYIAEKKRLKQERAKQKYAERKVTTQKQKEEELKERKEKSERFHKKLKYYKETMFDVPRGRETSKGHYKTPGQKRMPRTRPPGFASFGDIW